MTVAPGMADRIDTAVSAQNPQAAPKALRNGPEFEEICIRFDDGFCESRDSDGNNRKRLIYFNARHVRSGDFQRLGVAWSSRRVSVIRHRTLTPWIQCCQKVSTPIGVEYARLRTGQSGLGGRVGQMALGTDVGRYRSRKLPS